MVAVWSSDPTYGDPFEGVFYMRPPYSREQLELQAEQKGRRWATSMASKGFVMTAAPRLTGPFSFLQVNRHSLDETRRDEDEFVFVAWYRRSKPLLLSTDEIERRRVLARRYGITPNAPVRDGSPPINAPRPVMADEMGAYVDPAGRDHAGMTAEDREASGVAEEVS